MLSVLTVIGLVVVLLGIASPFFALIYQAGRDRMYQRLAERYYLKFEKKFVPAYRTWFARPPASARVVQGEIGGKNVLIGDYFGSFYDWNNNFDFLNGFMETKFFLNGQKQPIKLSPFWSLASEEQVDSFLKKVR